MWLTRSPLIDKAKVIQLFKKDCPLTSSNNKPISLLSVFSKIVEKVMYERLYKLLDEIIYFS